METDTSNSTTADFKLDYEKKYGSKADRRSKRRSSKISPPPASKHHSEANPSPQMSRFSCLKGGDGRERQKKAMRKIAAL